MKIAGFQKLSLSDYSGEIASVVFTAGCNFRCGYCHNPDILSINPTHYFSTGDILAQIKADKLLLDAVVITGGEPTIHKGLQSFCEEIKSIGLKIKLDSNGTNPNLLKTLIKNNLIDFVAIDIKSCMDEINYSQVTGIKIDQNILSQIQETIAVCKSGMIAYEFRTTVIKEIHSLSILKKITQINPKRLYLQIFCSDTVLDSNFKKYSAFSENEMEVIIRELKSCAPKIEIIVRS